ncbi:hypothetical protein [Haloarcula sp. K1]|uniref:hypothetical protein n=1 Tax=Haloarcula sp. K1 TaxID=1622207 RepID=UPI000AFB1C04|nr:hypothetical protein [Haloarcula sp. K1]
MILTIYPIGFGGATRDQLSAIANATGGEVNFVDDAAELPTVFSRVANTTTEINDTDGDGLSDEMEREGVILGGPNGDRVTTDPKSADTDGDGLSDSREIGQYTEVSYRGRTASYYNHLANPRQVDTDGDDLTDAEEVAGWEVQRIQSANASKGYLNVSRPDPSKRLLRSYLRSLYRGETESYQPQISRGPDSSSSKALAITIAEQTDIDVSTLNETGHGPSPNGSYLTNITATSDPLQPDTDHDGLADNVEHLRGTDPSRADTDGDGISDQTEFTSGTAPVLFDHRAPTVTIESIRTKRIKNTTKVIVRQQGTTKTVRPENIKTTDSTSSGAILVAKYRYTVRLRAHDPSGVSKLVVKPDCQYLARRAGSNLGSLMESACQGDGETIRFDNETTTSYRRVEFTVRTPIDKAGVFAFQEFSQFFESSPVAVTAVDSNRNSRSSDYTSPGAIPELAKTAADHPATGERTEDRVIEEIAYRSGGVWGVRQSALDLSYFLSHPWTAVTWLGNIDRLPDAALRAPETLPSAARNLQDRQNPFDRRTETENYKLYGQNWLVGYGSGVAGSELSIGLATGGGSTVSKAAKLRKVTDTVGDAGTAARGWTFHRSVRMASTISKGTDIKPAGTRRALGRVAIPERVRHAQRLNSPRWTRLIESLPERATGPSRTERVSRTMRRTGDDGRQLMLQLHNSGDQRALETFIAMDETPGTQRALVRASREDPDVSKQDLSEALQRYDSLETPEQKREMREVWRATGDKSVEATATMDQDALNDLMAIDIDSAVRAEIASKYTELDASQQRQLTAFVEENGHSGARVASAVDSDRLDNLLTADCGLSAPSIGRLPLGVSQYRRVQVPDTPTLSSRSSCAGTRLLETVAADGDISGSELNGLLARLGDSQVKPFANSVVESENPRAYLKDLNPGAVKRLAAEADEGVFRKTARTYDKYNRYKDNYETNKPSDLAEIYGEVLLQRRLGDDYRVISQAQVEFKGTSRSTEIDHLIIKDGEVIGFAETKDSKTADVGKQITKNKQFIDQYEVKKMKYPGSSETINAKLSTETINEGHVYTIGAGNKYDLQSLSVETMDVLYRGFSDN